ncbi:MAG TPA: hypothetical protein VMG82_25715 [Candidatus Sulfotelmatobacter sp.]|nr:hypothetical protein [Candidatus Sulfotelmatobacter sp.]
MLTVLCLLSAGFVAGDTSKQLEMDKEGTQLIGQLEDVARDVHYNAGRLNSFHPTQISKWTHYHHLEQIKSLVNDGLRPALERLTEIQPQLPAWHQEAIDQMLASAKALAADTNSAILNLNDTKALPIVLNAEYKELIARIYHHSESLVRTSDAAGDYAAAHLQAVEAGLKVPKH